MWRAKMQRKLSGYGQRHPSSAVIVSYAAKPRLTSSRLPTRLSTPETQRYVNAWATVRRASSNSTKIVGARIRAEKGTTITATAPTHRVVTRHVRSEKQKIVNSMEIMPRSSSIKTRCWAPAHGLWTNEHVRSPSQMLLSSLHAFPTADLARFYRPIPSYATARRACGIAPHSPATSAEIVTARPATGSSSFLSAGHDVGRPVSLGSVCTEYGNLLQLLCGISKSSV